MPTLPPSPHPGLVAELMQHPPFARMLPAQVERFVAAAQALAYRSGEVVVAPADGVVGHVWWLRAGRIEGRVAAGGEPAPGFQIDAADLFPVGAALGARAVTSTYVADGDCQCLRVPVALLRALAAESAPLADHLAARVAALLEASRQAQQAALSSQALAEQTMETPLGRLAVRAPAAVAPQTPLREALQQMHARGIGSMLVTDAAGAALGILTRHDLLGRVTLAQLSLQTPIGQVMSQPVHTLSVDHTAQDAVLLMSQRGVRHVPVTAGGRVVGIVSERDLYALHKLSVKQVGVAARAAADVATLTVVAADIRRLARNLLAQGVAARALTALITHLNDLVAQRLVELTAARHGLDLRRACWLAFGSEGRGEQTVATDQDNGLLYASDHADPDVDRPAWLAFAREVNAALDACGYPLCKGNVMAGNPQCCLTHAEWTARFERWIAQGSPTHLLEASIYFDLRPIAGNLALAAPLRERVVAAAAATPRFMKQMADNALRNAVPLNWRGAIVTHDEGGHRWLDLKLNASMPFVDAARLYALAHGVAATGTRARLEAAAGPMQTEPRELRHWCESFEFVQMLRLRVQIATHDAPGDGAAAHPNRIDVASLSDIDRRVLKDALGAARSLQQRMELDYLR
jgi:CBS domain-containing protein